MLAQKAIVTEIYNNRVEVEYQVNSSCSGCASEDNCGVGTVAKAFVGKTNRISINTSLILSKGQHVLIETLESNILLTSAITYLLPLFGLLIFSIIGQEVFVNQLGYFKFSSVIFGFIGGGIAQQLGKFWLKKNVNTQPIIVITQGHF